MGTPRTALVVAGMHRSGTSATTRLIHLLGADLAGDLIPASVGNERGHWESRAVQDLHNALLAELGSGIYSPVNIPAAWFDSADARPWIERMQALLAAEYPKSAFFVLKDPRMTLVLPLWREAMRRAAIVPRFVLPFRHPDAVAASLERRERQLGSGDALPHAQGAAVWLRYVLAAEKFTRGEPRAFVAFDALLADWRAQFARIGEQLGVAWPNWARAEKKIDAFLDVRRRDGETPRSTMPLGAMATDIYAGLEHAVVEPRAALTAFDDAAKTLAAAEELFGAHIVAREQVAEAQRRHADAELRRQEAERKDMHGRFENEIALRDARIAEAASHARRLEEALHRRDNERRSALHRLQSLDEDWAELHRRFDAEIALRDARVAEAATHAQRMQETLATLEWERRIALERADALEHGGDRAADYVRSLRQSRDEAIRYAQSLERARDDATAQVSRIAPAHSGPPVFFTIASRNYLAYAITLMQSVAEHYPDSPRYLILADREEGDETFATAPFTTILAEALALPDFESFAFRYTIMEFNTAIKPYAFAHLRQRHSGAGLVYLDPDILVVAPLIQVEAAFSQRQLAVLTPHLLEPIDDRRHPGERDILGSGTYNCGFIAIGDHDDADRLIAWWAQRLEFGAVSDIAAGLFTDQKWIDLVPGLFADVYILRDEGYNLAYWNVSQRQVSRREQRWYAGERPLAFVHFSGVDLERPSLFSKHQDRHDESSIGELAPLYRRYLDLLSANGHAEHRRKPYAFGHFADGEPICAPVRAVYRRYFDKGAPQGHPRPYSMDRRLYDLPCEELPERADAPITRVMYAAWNMREDLRRVFDLGQAEGREGFMHWFLRGGPIEMGVPQRHLDAVHRALAEHEAALARAQRLSKPRGAPRPLRRAGAAFLELINWTCRYPAVLRLYAMIPERKRHRVRRWLERVAFARKTVSPTASPDGQAEPGINLVGYAHGEFGVAEILRRYAHTLDEGGISFLVRNFDIGVASRQSDRSMQPFLAQDCRYDVNVFCINADQMPIARERLGEAVFGGRYNIACWFWELERFPERWHGAIDLVDEIWVTSPFVRDAIAACTPKPVHIVPVALEVDLPERVSRDDFGLAEDAFVYLVSFDFNSYITRKNPEAAIAAFRRAFADGRADVRLVIKTTNGDRHPAAMRRLIDARGGDTRIEVRDEFLDRHGMWALQACCDAYVSLHRSEGLGLGMAECMLLGKPVVATAYSGNLAFMDSDNSCLVGYDLVAVKKGEYPAWRNQHWAEPHIDQAAAYLKRLADDPAYTRDLGEKARASARQRLSAAASLTAMNARLAQIRAQRTQ